MNASPTLWRLFWVFLVMGATSIGGGVVGYLRAGLVARERWLDDKDFVELLSISQTLPGLNATNMAILVGDRLRGPSGAVLAALGMCLPGAMLMTGAGLVYGTSAEAPVTAAFLHAIAAGAVGLVLMVLFQLGAKVLKQRIDYVLVAVTAALVAGLDVAVPYALIGVGAFAIWWHRPRRNGGGRP